MSGAEVNPGSFRDPGSRIFEIDGRIFRAITPQGIAQYEAARDSGVLEELIGAGFFVSSRESDSAQAPASLQASIVLEHDRIPFVSYPYEWPFSLLKRAAIHHLDLQLAALDRGFTLTDATAYNIQFLGTRPIGIDHLSLKPYVEGEIWSGHRQFCMQFLNPLVLWSRLGISPNSWFRGTLEGIAPEDLAPLLRWKDKFSFTLLSHVVGQAALQKRAVKVDQSISTSQRPRLSKTGYRGMLEGLRGFIANCEPPRQVTVWGDYAENTSYDARERADKTDFVRTMVASVKPSLLYDLGCNSGDYSAASLDAGAGYVVGFDFDFGALEAAIARADRELPNFLPLWLDATNPSPAQGWAQSERMGFKSRAKPEAIIALAFIHHLAIGRNVPLDMAVDWLTSLAPNGIIEFPTKDDPMVKRLLANREDIFPDYSEGAFMKAVADRAQVVDSKVVSKSGRVLVRYSRS